jgi:Ribosomal RNA large subunit methyltransferase N-terminal domain
MIKIDMENEEKVVMKKPLLKGLTLPELQNYFAGIGEPKFRGEQVFN